LCCREIPITPDFLLEIHAELVRVVVADPNSVGNACQLVVPEFVSLGWSHGAHPAAITLEVAEIRTDDAREARRGRRCTLETQVRDRVVGDDGIRRAVRIMKTKIADTGVSDQRRRKCTFEIEPHGMAVDLLIAPPGNWNRQTISARELSC